MATTSESEAWKTFGWVRGQGIPAPTGKHVVGCVDLMHMLEGDSDGLLVRMFYPTNHIAEVERARYPYAKHIPHKRYLRGWLDFTRVSFPGLKTALLNLLMGKNTCSDHES